MKKKAPPKKEIIRVLVVDDHPIVRHGINQLLSHEDDFVICGEAEKSSQALTAVDKLKPDIALIDISLQGESGVELIKNIKVRSPQLPLLVVSIHDESLYAERALRAGAKGYIMKQESTENLIHAIRHILNGSIYVSEKMESRILHQFVNGRFDPKKSPIDLLSDRELDVFQFIGRGAATRQIADQLHLSVKTIESYRANIKEKLNLHNGKELVQYAILWLQCENN